MTKKRITSFTKSDLDYLMTEQAAIMSANEAFDLACLDHMNRSDSQNSKYMTSSEKRELMSAYEVYFKIQQYSKKLAETFSRDDRAHLKNQIASLWSDDRIKGFKDHNKQVKLKKYVPVGQDLYRLEQSIVADGIYKLSCKDFDEKHGTKVIPIDESFSFILTYFSNLDRKESLFYKKVNKGIRRKYYGISQHILLLFVQSCVKSLANIKSDKNMVISDAKFEATADVTSDSINTGKEEPSEEVQKTSSRRVSLPRQSKSKLSLSNKKKRIVDESSESEGDPSFEDSSVNDEEAEWSDSLIDEEPLLEDDPDTGKDSTSDKDEVKSIRASESEMKLKNDSVTTRVNSDSSKSVETKIPKKNRVDKLNSTGREGKGKEDNSSPNDHMCAIDAVLKAANEEAVDGNQNVNNDNDSSRNQNSNTDGNEKEKENTNSLYSNTGKDTNNDGNSGEKRHKKEDKNKFNPVVETVSSLRNNRNMWSIILDLFLTDIGKNSASSNVFTLLIFDLGSGKCWFHRVGTETEKIMMVVKEKLYELFSSDGWPSFVSYHKKAIGFNLNRYKKVTMDDGSRESFEFDDSEKEPHTYVEESDKDTFVGEVS